MRQHTDATLALTLKGVDLSGTTFRVSVKKGDTEIYKTDADCAITAEDDGCTVYAPLSIEDTDALKTGTCSVQINWIDDAGKRHATDISRFTIKENQDRGEL